MRGGRWRGAGRDRGAATVWVVVVMAVLCVVCGAVLAMAQVIVARHRAGGAADLAALAAADRWGEGRAEACDAAGRVARAQDARLVRCAVYGEVSEVRVSAEAGPFAAEVDSGAGPAGPAGQVGPGQVVVEAAGRSSPRVSWGSWEGAWAARP
ncbi:Rv3654c family TadE-like protein [Streptomyces sp. NPDC059002]|uniref:Rv3654c family TadE-like protein n=1 Tax=Streptomyces sp. NPDC059002 TaxID=3346690 RepID=UPI0036D01815